MTGFGSPSGGPEVIASGTKTVAGGGTQENIDIGWTPSNLDAGEVVEPVVTPTGDISGFSGDMKHSDPDGSPTTGLQFALSFNGGFGAELKLRNHNSSTIDVAWQIHKHPAP